MLIRNQKWLCLGLIPVNFALISLAVNADDFSNILNNVNQVLQQTNEAMRNSQQQDAGANNKQNQGGYPQSQGNYPPQPSYNPPPNTPTYGNQAPEPQKENSREAISSSRNSTHVNRDPRGNHAASKPTSKNSGLTLERGPILDIWYDSNGKVVRTRAAK